MHTAAFCDNHFVFCKKYAKCRKNGAQKHSPANSTKGNNPIKNEDNTKPQ